MGRLQTKAPIITPGGRVGDDRRLGSRTNGENWVERSKPGGNGSLPKYIRIVRNGLMKDGKDEQTATRLAVAAVERWATGRGNVSPKVRAAAAAAVAEWEAMRGKAHASKSFDHYAMEVKRRFSPDDLEKLGKAGKAFKNANGDWSYPTPEESDLRNAVQAFGRAMDEDKPALKRYLRRRATQLGVSDAIPDTWGDKSVTVQIQEGDDMQIEHKTVGVSGVKVLGDADDGIVEAFVSVTGIKDTVNDIIEPGAYAETLKTRLPKGIWSHDWNQPISKTLEAKELLPGDPMLPDTLPNGEPWPAEAGALWVKTQFNLAGERGRQAYADVVFFGDQQEWSIGYNVPAGKATISTKGVQKTRNIKGLDLYEFSPVLWGAMPHSRSKTVKEAQFTHMQFKSLFGDDYYVQHDSEELEAFLDESKSFFGDIEAKTIEDRFATDETVENLGEVEEEDALFDMPFAGKGILSAENIKLLQQAQVVITDLLDAAVDGFARSERKALPDLSPDMDIEDKALSDIFDSVEMAANLDSKALDLLSEMVGEFDTAYEQEDAEKVEEAATKIIDFIDDEIDSQTPEAASDLKVLAGGIASLLTKMDVPDDGSGSGGGDSKPASRERQDSEDDVSESKTVTLEDFDVKSLAEFFA